MEGSGINKQSKTASKKATSDHKRPKPKNNGTEKKAVIPEPENEDSDLDLENELDKENALNELAGDQDLSTDDDDEVCTHFQPI